MQYNDIINNGSLVYQSQAGDKKLREWRIEERTCSVKFYNTEPLSEFDSIILRLIDSTDPLVLSGIIKIQQKCLYSINYWIVS